MQASHTYVMSPLGQLCSCSCGCGGAWGGEGEGGKIKGFGAVTHPSSSACGCFWGRFLGAISLGQEFPQHWQKRGKQVLHLFQDCSPAVVDGWVVQDNLQDIRYMSGEAYRQAIKMPSTVALPWGCWACSMLSRQTVTFGAAGAWGSGDFAPVLLASFELPLLPAAVPFVFRLADLFCSP